MQHCVCIYTLLADAADEEANNPLLSCLLQLPPLASDWLNQHFSVVFFVVRLIVTFFDYFFIFPSFFFSGICMKSVTPILLLTLDLTMSDLYLVFMMHPETMQKMKIVLITPSTVATPSMQQQRGAMTITPVQPLDRLPIAEEWLQLSLRKWW